MAQRKFEILLSLTLLCFGLQREVNGQYQNGFLRQVPRQGSVSRVNSNAYEREVDYGPVDFNSGVTNSRVVTKNRGGFRNGGTTSVANTNAVSQGVNVGGLDIGGTFTRSRTRTNGAVSQGLGYDFNVGNLGLGASFDPNNLRNGFGLKQNRDGDVSLGLGLLNLDLSQHAQSANNPYSQAQVNAQGKNAFTKANSNVRTQNGQYGGVGVKETFLNSNAVGRTKFGQTSGNTNTYANGALSNGATYGSNDLRYRRAPAPARAPAFALPQFLYRPRRDTTATLAREKRQFGYGGFGGGFGGGFRGYGGRPAVQRPGFGYQQPGFGYQQPGFGFRPNFNQQAGANTHSKNEYNENGFFQDNGSSSIGSNLAEDGSEGQVSSANVNQQQSQTNGGFQSTNDAQSQSLNFNKLQQQAANTNAGTKHTINQNGERIGAVGGAQVTDTNPFGTSSNIANTNSNVYNENGVQGSDADSSSQSIFQGNNGENSAALTNSKTSSIRNPDGSVSNSASSNASATSTNGQSANANANSSAGDFGNNANSGAFTGVNEGPVNRPPRRKPNRRDGRMNFASAVYREKRRYPNNKDYVEEIPHHHTVSTVTKVSNNTEIFEDFDEDQKSGRTFDVIGEFINNLLAPCVDPCTYEALRQNRCCNAIVLAPPLPLPPPGCCQQRPIFYPQQQFPMPQPIPIPRPIPIPTRPPVIIVPPVPRPCCRYCNYYNYGMRPCYGNNYLFGRLTAKVETVTTSSTQDIAQVTILVP